MYARDSRSWDDNSRENQTTNDRYRQQEWAEESRRSDREDDYNRSRVRSRGHDSYDDRDQRSDYVQSSHSRDDKYEREWESDRTKRDDYYVQRDYSQHSDRDQQTRQRESRRRNSEDYEPHSREDRSQKSNKWEQEDRYRRRDDDYEQHRPHSNRNSTSGDDYNDRIQRNSNRRERHEQDDYSSRDNRYRADRNNGNDDDDDQPRVTRIRGGGRTESYSNNKTSQERDPQSHIRNWEEGENEGEGGKLTPIGRVLVSGAGITPLEQKCADLKAECEDLESKLEAQLARQSRNDPSETYVWVLVEYDNFGCERYLNGYANLPPDWKVLLFRNKNATGRMPPVQGACVVYSLLGGSSKGPQKKGKSTAKKDEKSSLTYPGSDLCMTVGDIAMRASERDITRQTTIYFVCTPVSDPPRYFQQMLMLKDMGIQSSTFDGAGCIDDIFDREGLSTELYKTSHHHRTPKLRATSKPPAPRTASRGRV